jgi:hypothetical protein
MLIGVKRYKNARRYVVRARYYVRTGIVSAVILIFVQSGSAALWQDPAAMPSYSGTAPFGATGDVLTGYVDYAVYDKHAYSGSVIFPNLYVYAYQVFNNIGSTAAIDFFSVSLNPGVQASHADWEISKSYSAPGGSIPAPSVLPQSVIYLFPFVDISPGENSRTLYFASDCSPGPAMGKGVIFGGSGGRAFVNVPTPWLVPEPATMLLLGLGVIFVLKRKRGVRG